MISVADVVQSKQSTAPVPVVQNRGTASSSAYTTDASSRTRDHSPSDAASVALEAIQAELLQVLRLQQQRVAAAELRLGDGVADVDTAVTSAREGGSALHAPHDHLYDTASTSHSERRGEGDSGIPEYECFLAQLRDQQRRHTDHTPHPMPSLPQRGHVMTTPSSVFSTPRPISHHHHHAAPALRLTPRRVAPPLHLLIADSATTIEATRVAQSGSAGAGSAGGGGVPVEPFADVLLRDVHHARDVDKAAESTTAGHRAAARVKPVSSSLIPELSTTPRSARAGVRRRERTTRHRAAALPVAVVDRCGAVPRQRTGARASHTPCVGSAMDTFADSLVGAALSDVFPRLRRRQRALTRQLRSPVVRHADHDQGPRATSRAVGETHTCGEGYGPYYYYYYDRGFRPPLPHPGA